MAGGENPAPALFVIGRFDRRLERWREVARLPADDRIDALEQWALVRGGFDSLEPGLYGSRREGEDGPWYRRETAGRSG